MGFTSANNTNVNQSNENYEVDGIIFASRFICRSIKSIDRNLRFLYTPGSASNDWETINHSITRENEASFVAILDRVDERIDRIENIDDGSTNQFLYKEKRGGAFFEKFSVIEDCLNEGVHSEPQNNFETRISDIVRRLSYIGIDPYY